MRFYRRYLAWLMDKACEVTGHGLRCYNEPRWVNRVWFWALTGDDGPEFPALEGPEGWRGQL